MAGDPSFTGPNGMNPVRAINLLITEGKPTDEDLLFGGQVLISEIRTRTAQGVDSDGATFQPYSEKYAQQKIKHLGSASPVDLFGYTDPTGHMLNALQSQVLGGELDVGFWGPEAERARVHNLGAEISKRPPSINAKKRSLGKQPYLRQASTSGTFAMPRRHFFDANQRDIHLMQFGIGERIMKRLKNGA